MSDQIEFRADRDTEGRRLDQVLAERAPGYSRTALRALIDDGAIAVNDSRARPGQRLRRGDRVAGRLTRRPSLNASPEKMPLHIVYQDADLAVIDKPAGLVIHPAPGHESGTLVNALVARFPTALDDGTGYRPGIVHRLDKDTSGLLVVALNPASQASLQRQIATRTARRTYLALVAGVPFPASGTIDAPIGRDRSDRKRMATHGAAAREARTTYQVLEELLPYSLLQATLHTGRTHQIRVHLAAVRHPIAGDKTYGGPSISGLERQFLHAQRLQIASPSTGETLSFESPLPPDLQSVLNRLRSGDRA